MKDYFESDTFWKVPRDLLERKLCSEAIHKISVELEAFKFRHPDQYEKEHKGLPYYYLGYAAFMSHDYVGAPAYFDAALEADYQKYISNGDLNENAGGASAPLFMKLKTGDRLADEPVRDIISKLEELIHFYNALNEDRTDGKVKAIGVNKIRNEFLTPIVESEDSEKRTLVTTFISFIAEWAYRSRMIALVEQGSREPYLLHLFRGCLLLESLLKNQIKPNAKQDRTLDKYFEKSWETPLNLLKSKKGALKEIYNLGDIIGKLIGLMSVEDSMQMTWSLRNTVGHDVAWTVSDLNKENYDKLVCHVGAACLRVIISYSWS